MTWRRILRFWIVLALLAAWPALFYMAVHGQCDEATCGPNWLPDLLEVFALVGVAGTFVIWLTRNSDR